MCTFELFETKFHYEPCLKNVSNTVNNRYKGNYLTMKRLTIFTGGRPLKNTKIKIQKQIKKFGTHFSPLFKEKKLLPYNNYSNHVYVEFYCASNGKMTIFYFCKSIELYSIKG
jgi:hypothetical protein